MSVVEEFWLQERIFRFSACGIMLELVNCAELQCWRDICAKTDD